MVFEGKKEDVAACSQAALTLAGLARSYPTKEFLKGLPSDPTSSLFPRFSAAALNGSGPHEGKCFFFYGNWVIRFNWETGCVDWPPSPKTFTFFGLPEYFQQTLTTALNGSGLYQGKCFFFNDPYYIRLDWKTMHVDQAPRIIKDDWKFPAEFETKNMAALEGGPGYENKCYFFQGDTYIRYDWEKGCVDPGYPKLIRENWRNMPPGFESNIRTALTEKGPYERKCYFFKGDSYVSYDWNFFQADLPQEIVFNPPSRSRCGQFISWGEGRLDVFWRGKDNRIKHKYHICAWSPIPWSTEEDLGGDLDTKPVVVSWGKGRLDLFWRGRDGHLKHKWHPCENDWSWEQDLGGDWPI